MILRSLSLVLLISLLRLPFLAAAPDESSSQKNQSAISILNLIALPAQIIGASIESMIVNSSVEVEVYNTSAHTLLELRLRILKYSNSKLIETADGVIRDLVPVRNHSYRTTIDMTLEQDTQVALIVTKVRTSTGVWFINSNTLSHETKLNAGTTSKLQNAVTYECNIELTPEEKKETLTEALKQLALDSGQSAFIGNHGRMLMARDASSYATQLSKAIPLDVLSLQEIQTIADKDRRAVYISAVAFDVEGSSVKVNLTLNDRHARTGKPIVASFRDDYEFILLKQGDKWVVEKPRN